MTSKTSKTILFATVMMAKEAYDVLQKMINLTIDCNAITYDSADEESVEWLLTNECCSAGAKDSVKALITLWDEKIYFDEKNQWFQSMEVMNTDIDFGDGFYTYFRQHKIEGILSLQGYGAFITTPQNKTHRLFIDELDIYRAMDKAKDWIDKNYSFPPEQMLFFPS